MFKDGIYYLKKRENDYNSSNYGKTISIELSQEDLFNGNLEFMTDADMTLGKSLQQKAIRDYKKSMNESKFIEADEKVNKLIKDFIETDWSKDDESKGKAMNMLKGIIYSDDANAKKFIKDLDKKSNSMNVEDYK